MKPTEWIAILFLVFFFFITSKADAYDACSPGDHASPAMVTQETWLHSAISGQYIAFRGYTMGYSIGYSTRRV